MNVKTIYEAAALIEKYKGLCLEAGSYYGATTYLRELEPNLKGAVYLSLKQFIDKDFSSEDQFIKRLSGFTSKDASTVCELNSSLEKKNIVYLIDDFSLLYENNQPWLHRFYSNLSFYLADNPNSNLSMIIAIKKHFPVNERRVLEKIFYRFNRPAVQTTDLGGDHPMINALIDKDLSLDVNITSDEYMANFLVQNKYLFPAWDSDLSSSARILLKSLLYSKSNEDSLRNLLRKEDSNADESFDYSIEQLLFTGLVRKEKNDYFVNGSIIRTGFRRLYNLKKEDAEIKCMTRKFSTHILKFLNYSNGARFNEIQKNIIREDNNNSAIPSITLSKTLQIMEVAGIVLHNDEFYKLTDLGRKTAKKISASAGI
jgi:hypothetical protein